MPILSALIVAAAIVFHAHHVRRGISKMADDLTIAVNRLKTEVAETVSQVADALRNAVDKPDTDRASLAADVAAAADQLDQLQTTLQPTGDTTQGAGGADDSVNAGGGEDTVNG